MGRRKRVEIQVHIAGLFKGLMEKIDPLDRCLDIFWCAVRVCTCTNVYIPFKEALWNVFWFWGLAIASYSRYCYSFYLAWGLQSDQHTGLRGGSDKTEGSSGHLRRARSFFSPARIDCTLWRIHRKTLWLSLAVFFFCASVTSVGKRDSLLPCPLGISMVILPV